MYLNNSRIISDSENHQPSPVFHYDPQDNDGLNVLPLRRETGIFHSNENVNNVIYNPINDNSQIQPVHPNVFFYRPPNHFYHYRVSCEEISCDAIEGLLNVRVTQHRGDEYIFFYQQRCDNKFYRILCEIAPPLLVNDCLNNNFLGIDLQNQNMEQERLTFTADQKEDLKYYLKKYLSRNFLS